MTLTQQALTAMAVATRPLVGHAKTVPNFQKATQLAKRALCNVCRVHPTKVFLLWHPPDSWEGTLSARDFRFEVVTRRSLDALRTSGICLVPFEWERNCRVPQEDSLAERWLISDTGLL